MSVSEPKINRLQLLLSGATATFWIELEVLKMSSTIVAASMCSYRLIALNASKVQSFFGVLPFVQRNLNVDDVTIKHAL